MVDFSLTERNVLTGNYKQFDLIFNGNETEIILHFVRGCIEMEPNRYRFIGRFMCEEKNELLFCLAQITPKEHS